MMLTKTNNYLIILLFLTIVIGFLPVGKFNFNVQLIFTCIGFISLFGVFFTKTKGQGYSLNTVFWLFNYTFFFIAPVIQFKHQTVFQLPKLINDSLYINAALIILLSSLVYFITYKIFMIKLKTIVLKKETYLLNFSILISISSIALLLFLYLIKFNVDVLLFRPASGWLKQHTHYGNFGYAIVSVIRYVPFFCLIIYLLSRENNKKRILILTLLTLLITFPFSLSRGILAALYLPLILLLFPMFKKKYYFLVLFLIAITIIFPLANNFRDLTTGGFAFNYELFNSPHFDAFQNFMLLIKSDIVTNGQQIIHNFLFFTSKFKGSGQILGEQIGYNYYNVAMPFIGEGFINFGYFGIIIFVIFIAFINALFDKYSEKLNLPFKSIYLVLIGFEFYILRGDLSSAIKKMVGFILALLLVWGIIIINTKITSKNNLS